MIAAPEVATAAVAFLAPFLPALKGLAGAAYGKLAETVAEKGGEAAWEKAKALWDRISSRWGEDPEVSGTALLVAATPERTDRRSDLAEALATRLAGEPVLLQEIQALLGGERRVQEIAAGDRAVLEHVTQRMVGPGLQRITLGDDARLSNINQIIES